MIAAANASTMKSVSVSTLSVAQLLSEEDAASAAIDEPSAQASIDACPVGRH